MSNLLLTQRALQNYLLDSIASSDADDLISKKIVDPMIAENDRVPCAMRLRIYASAYPARIIESLSVDFSGLHAYLGDDAFAELVGAYIERYPSRFFSLRNVGSNLADFLKNIPPYAEHIELHELAIFEWALCHAFDAADAACLDASNFSTLPSEQWPEITLRFIPSLKVVFMRTNVAVIWKALNDEQAPPAVEIATKGQPWLIWRRELKIMFRPLDAVESAALDIFGRGASLAEVCGQLAEMLPESEVPQRAVAILQQWLNDRLIVAS